MKHLYNLVSRLNVQISNILKCHRYLVSSIIFASLSGCHAGHPTIDKSQILAYNPTLKTAFENEFNGVFLGSPLKVVAEDEYSDEKLIPLSSPSCVTIPENTQLAKGVLATRYYERLNLNNEDVLRDLTGDLDLQVSNDLGNIKAVAELLDLNKNANTKFTLSISARSSQPVYLKQKFTQTIFDNECGDGYVYSVQAGIYFLAQIEFDFSDELKKQSILAMMDGSLGRSLESLTGILEILKQQNKGSVSINIRVMQLGGDTSNIFSLLAQNIGKASATTTPGVYLSSIESLADIQKIQSLLENYARTEIMGKQQDFYLQDPTIANLQYLFISPQKLKIQKYKQSQTIKYYNADLLEQIDSYQELYTKLLNTYQAYEKFYRIIHMYANSYTRPATSVADIQERLWDLEGLINQIKNDYIDLYDKLIISKDQSLTEDDLDLIAADKKQVDSLLTTINNSGYKGGFKLRSNPIDLADSEYLIYLGEDDDNSKYFLTYATNFPSAIYNPGTIYKYKPETKEIISVVRPLITNFKPLIPQSLFMLHGAGIGLTSGISYDAVNYPITDTFKEPSSNNGLNKFLSYNNQALK